MQPDQYESKRKERVKQNIFHNEQSIWQSYLEWRIMVVLNLRQYLFIRFIFIAFFFSPFRGRYVSSIDRKCRNVFRRGLISISRLGFSTRFELISRVVVSVVSLNI